MGFQPQEVEELLARTGRMCAICKRRHRVQVHHITPISERGSDHIDNAIPLCPNCHDEVHSPYAPGRITRSYSASELRGHLAETIRLARREAEAAPGTRTWEADRELVLFYAQCLDRPAFQTHFHMELSFADMDRALEDTLLALNTGFWRTRDGTLIERARGKVHVANPVWRERLDEAAASIDAARRLLRDALGLDIDLYRWERGHASDRLRYDRDLGAEIDRLRETAVKSVNAILRDLGQPELRSIR
jgi:HNH endonuclease